MQGHDFIFYLHLSTYQFWVGSLIIVYFILFPYTNFYMGLNTRGGGNGLKPRILVGSFYRLSIDFESNVLSSIKKCC